MVWRIVLAQVRRNRGRAAAMVASIVVTSVSFSLLTASVATSKVEVEGTVTENFRNAYDILVRPPRSRTPLEESEQLVRENYLSGIYGGITMRQYRQISKMPGVDVAAPIAMVAYFTPAVGKSFIVNDLIGPQQHQLLRISFSWTTDRGLSTVPDKQQYQYVTRSPWTIRDGQAVERDPLTGQKLAPCASLAGQTPAQRNAFDLKSQVAVWCNSTRTQLGYSDFFKRGQFGGFYYYDFPMLLAAIDPVQEARLVGLDEAVTTGRYLSVDDRPRVMKARPRANSLRYPRVPVLMADRSLLDQTLNVRIERLNAGDPNQIPGRLAAEDSLKWLEKLPPSRVLKRVRVGMDAIYPLMLRRYHQRAALVGLNKWTAGPVAYQTGADGRLRPVPVKNDKFAWRDLRQGFRAPQLSSDTNYRRIKEELGSNLILGLTSYNPILRWVGLYDADKIRDYSELSEVPLTTYHAPDATPADAASASLLAGRSLLPNGNLAGYLQQPPTVLTTLEGMKAFYDHRGFPDSDGSAPISVIRIRASGVSGPDAESRERVRVLAERIIRETGLDVDITVGSSPTDKVVTLPAGRYGRPELNLSEGWVHKGVTVVLLDAIDHKSLVVSLLVLGVCLLFLINATLAAVRTRRRELGVLSCVGWPRHRIFAVLEYELVTIGLIAGLLGTIAGGVLVWTAGLNVALWQVLAITPLAALLAGLAGLVPIWRACSASPVDAIRPAGRAPRSASKVRSISGLAFAGMRRLPGRTFLGASCLFVGVAALTSLVAIQSAFHGQVIGTRLGDYVAVQVRGVDYLAAAITIGLGAFAIADIVFLNIRERIEEIGILQASGWSIGHLRRMFATEGIATAALGALTGTMAGLAGTAAFLTIGWQPALTGSLIATTAGLAAAILALTIPLARISRLAPAHAVARE